MTTVSRSRPTSRQLPNYLSAEEVEGLLSVVDDVPYRMLFQVEWRAGLRVSEALHLQVQDVNLRGDRPSLRVVCGKGREVPGSTDTPRPGGRPACLRRHDQGRPPVRGSEPPHSPPPPAGGFATAQALKLIGPKRRCSNHTLRHSAARHWLASGIPINVVRNWLGHSRLTSTMVYLELFSDPGDLISQVR